MQLGGISVIDCHMGNISSKLDIYLFIFVEKQKIKQYE